MRSTPSAANSKVPCDDESRHWPALVSASVGFVSTSGSAGPRKPAMTTSSAPSFVAPRITSRPAGPRLAMRKFAAWAALDIHRLYSPPMEATTAGGIRHDAPDDLEPRALRGARLSAMRRSPRGLQLPPLSHRLSNDRRHSLADAGAANRPARVARPAASSPDELCD